MYIRIYMYSILLDKFEGSVFSHGRSFVAVKEIHPNQLLYLCISMFLICNFLLYLFLVNLWSSLK